LRQHLFSRDDVVRVAFVFSDAFVEDGAMGVAEWYVSRFRSKAIPDQLEQAQPIRGRELENFGNIGVAHGIKATTVAVSTLTPAISRAASWPRGCNG
jgi:hypothetical protein